MANLKPFAALGTAERVDPCIEYPGNWIVYSRGECCGEHTTLEAARTSAVAIASTTKEHVTISWGCSEDDPRVGRVWFTSYYRHSVF